MGRCRSGTAYCILGRWRREASDGAGGLQDLPRRHVSLPIHHRRGHYRDSRRATEEADPRRSRDLFGGRTWVLMIPIYRYDAPGEMRVGVRGRLRLDSWARHLVTTDPELLEPWLLMYEWSEMVGLNDFSGSPHIVPRWSQGEVDGDWTQDGRERLIAWAQLGLAAHAARSGDKVTLPLQAASQALARVLERVGTFAIDELESIVPLDVIPPAPKPEGVAAHGRDWLALGIQKTKAEPLVIGLGTRTPTTSIHQKQMLELLQTYGEDVLHDLTFVPREAAHPPRSTVVEFPGIVPYGDDAVYLVGRTQVWSLTFAAWMSELLALACARVGLHHSVAIAVRRVAEV